MLSFFKKFFLQIVKFLESFGIWISVFVDRRGKADTIAMHVCSKCPANTIFLMSLAVIQFTDSCLFSQLVPVLAVGRSCNVHAKLLEWNLTAQILIRSHDWNVIHSVFQFFIITHLPIKHKKLKAVKILDLLPPQDKRYKSTNRLDDLTKQVTHILQSGTFMPCGCELQVCEKILALISLLLGDGLYFVSFLV